MNDGYIGGGMLPKLQNCIDAIENGVSRVHILDGADSALSAAGDLYRTRELEPQVLNGEESRYYHGEQ